MLDKSTVPQNTPLDYQRQGQKIVGLVIWIAGLTITLASLYDNLFLGKYGDLTGNTYFLYLAGLNLFYLMIGISAIRQNRITQWSQVFGFALFAVLCLDFDKGFQPFRSDAVILILYAVALARFHYPGSRLYAAFWLGAAFFYFIAIGFGVYHFYVLKAENVALSTEDDMLFFIVFPVLFYLFFSVFRLEENYFLARRKNFERQQRQSRFFQRLGAKTHLLAGDLYNRCLKIEDKRQKNDPDWKKDLRELDKDIRGLLDAASVAWRQGEPELVEVRGVVKGLIRIFQVGEPIKLKCDLPEKEVFQKVIPAEFLLKWQDRIEQALKEGRSAKALETAVLWRQP